MSDTTKTIPNLETLRAQRSDILALAAKHGASNVRVFGSVARGEAEADSDIDFLVSVNSQTSIFDVIALWLDLKDLLGREVSLMTEGDHLDENFARSIHRDLVLL